MIRLVSPHLTIYKPQFNSILSIFNRITGAVLALVLLFAFNLLDVWSSYNYTVYAVQYFISVFGSYVSSAFIFFVVLAFVYHFVFGLEEFAVSIVRPEDYSQVDEYDLSQLYYLFKVKTVFVVFISLGVSTFLTSLFF